MLRSIWFGKCTSWIRYCWNDTRVKHIHCYESWAFTKTRNCWKSGNNTNNNNKQQKILTSEVIWLCIRMYRVWWKNNDYYCGHILYFCFNFQLPFSPFFALILYYIYMGTHIFLSCSSFPSFLLTGSTPLVLIMKQSSSSFLSSSTSSNPHQQHKQQKVHDQQNNFIEYLLGHGEFSTAVVEQLTEMVSLDQMSSVVSTCQELNNADLTLYVPTDDWNDGNDVRKMFTILLATPTTKWIGKNWYIEGDKNDVWGEGLRWPRQNNNCYRCLVIFHYKWQVSIAYFS